MKIAVGSDNPVKIEAVKAVMAQVFPRAEIVSVKVISGVSDNPADDAEAITGAKERASRARAAVSGDLGVGLEGGTTVVAGRLMTGGWAAVYDGERFYVGGGGHLVLPPAVSRKVQEEGKELGRAMDEFVGARDTKRKMGAIGILSRGLSDRQRAYQEILAYALAPLISKKFYSDDLRLPGDSEQSR